MFILTDYNIKIILGVHRAPLVAKWATLFFNKVHFTLQPHCYPAKPGEIWRTPLPGFDGDLVRGITSQRQTDIDQQTGRQTGSDISKQ